MPRLENGHRVFERVNLKIRPSQCRLGLYFLLRAALGQKGIRLQTSLEVFALFALCLEFRFAAIQSLQHSAAMHHGFPPPLQRLSQLSAQNLNFLL
eukprot:CAMPEP_0179438228 /NCGR_PEP_ID=MMETSP0799-20121207/21993_1 /TAXON_ID=46947 /ORGANISM="Geminigera cryophila, Strain CCMP2564" /LENGTH=95 /DNA_ID=CAMNT_0021219699 /DNA_START=223 /DNA_END=510 /DNA_ORIENTATION=-